jgi:putative transcriptional regulator
MDVFEHVGMDNAVGANAPLYVGGPIERNRICLVHSNDWASSSTLEISPELSVTTDISVLAAISQGIGPSLYRACCGVSSWGPNQLEGEMKGKAPWTFKHRWLDIQGTEKNVFDTEPELQWNSLLTQAVELEVKEWF